MYDYDHSEQGNRHRPPSRASQHSAQSIESGNGHHGNSGGNHHYRTQNIGKNTQQRPAHQYQQSALEDRGAVASDDDMW